MGRLIWKELRENVWMMGVTLAVPSLLLLLSYYTSTEHPWKGFSKPPNVLMLANVVFALWGALQSSSEQKRSIRFLPLRWWNPTVIKMNLGFMWAWICAILVHSVGVRSLDYINCLFTASGMIFSYLIALLAGMLWGVGFSGVLGAVAGLFGLMFLIDQYNLDPYYGAYVILLSILGLYLALSTMTILTAFLRVRAYNIKQLRIATAAYFFLLIGAVYFGAGIDTAADGYYASQAVCESHRFGKVAYVTTEFLEEVRTGYRTRLRNTQTLYLADIDGRNSIMIAKGYWAYPLLWTPNGELVYTVSIANEYITRVCIWSILTRKSRAVTDLPIISNMTNFTPTIDPKGRYVAVICEKRGIDSHEISHNLWIIDLQKNMKRLAFPSIDWETTPVWRGGKLYLRKQGNWMEISPEGGLPHPVQTLPGRKGEERI